MRHWWLMAIHALPYQMETINELFSLLYAGHTEKGTEQGRANLKQCRRLDACLGQTRIKSFGLTGEAQRVHRALAQGGVTPEALGSSRVSTFIPHALYFPRITDRMPHGKAESRVLALCSMGKPQHGELLAPEQCLRAGSARG